MGLASFVLLGMLPGCGSNPSEILSGDPDASIIAADGSGLAVAPPPVMDANPSLDGAQAASALQRELDPKVPAADMATLASDNGAFAFDLYRKLTADSGNVVFSPASVSIALAMTYAGAANATATEMAGAIHFTLPQVRLHRAFNGLDQMLASRGQELPAGAARLNVANSMWLEQSYQLLPSFLDTLAWNYGAGVSLVDFIHAPDASRLKINAWAADRTSGKIAELLAPGMINDLTRLVLTNTVYFNAAWLNPFNALNNHANNFTLLDGSVASRNFMYASLSASAMQGAKFVAASLPYQDARLSMVVVVPDAGEFAQVEASFDWASLASLVNGAAYQKISLYLPPFHLDTRASLPEALKSLGMTSAFCHPGPADFSAMGAGGLCISEVIHEAFITVAEQGTEAGAATAVVLADSSIAMDAGAPPLLVRADRPFLYFIYDNPTQTILFMGRVLDPNQN
jgi:serpin B